MPATLREPLTHAERGTLGARARWGPPRIKRLDEYAAVERRLIDALFAALDAGKADPAAKTGSAKEDGDGSADPRRRAS